MQSPPGPTGGPPVLVESTEPTVVVLVDGSMNVVLEVSEVVVGLAPDSPLPSPPPLSPQPAHKASRHEKEAKRRMWAAA